MLQKEKSINSKEKKIKNGAFEVYSQQDARRDST